MLASSRKSASSRFPLMRIISSVLRNSRLPKHVPFPESISLWIGEWRDYAARRRPIRVVRIVHKWAGRLHDARAGGHSLRSTHPARTTSDDIGRKLMDHKFLRCAAVALGLGALAVPAV